MIKLVRRLFTVPDLKTGDNIQRFYKKANTAKSDSGFEILLDGRRIKTPEKRDFIVQSELLALSIASEWENQEKFIIHHRMPLVL